MRETETEFQIWARALLERRAQAIANPIRESWQQRVSDMDRREASRTNATRGPDSQREAK